MVRDPDDILTISMLDEDAAVGGRFTKFRVRPGELTTPDRDRIFELAEQGMKAWTIAKAIKRHPSSVSWFMYRNGLQKLRATPRKSFVRNGRFVHSFDPDEDVFITKLRVNGINPTEIASRSNERFGRNRTRDTIALRLLMLASHDNMTEYA